MQLKIQVDLDLNTVVRANWTPKPDHRVIAYSRHVSDHTNSDWQNLLKSDILTY